MKAIPKHVKTMTISFGEIATGPACPDLPNNGRKTVRESGKTGILVGSTEPA